MTELATTTASELWQDAKKIKDLCFKDLGQNEFELLVKFGQALGANPFLKEIYWIKSSPFLTRDFYRKTAKNQPNYRIHNAISFYENDRFQYDSGIVNHSFSFKDRGALVGAYCTTYVKGEVLPYVQIVLLKEVKLNTPVWDKCPDMMVCKVAESRCLRLAFNVFQGTYGEGEEWAEPTKDIPFEDVTPPTPTPPAPDKIESTIKIINSTQTLENLQLIWKALPLEMKKNLSVIDAKDAKKDWLSQPHPESIEDLVIDAEFIENENELLANLAKCKTITDWEFVWISAIDNAPYLNNDSTIKKVEALKLTKKLK